MTAPQPDVRSPWTLREDRYSGEFHWMVTDCNHHPIFDSVNRSPAMGASAADEAPLEHAQMQLAAAAPQLALALQESLSVAKFFHGPEAWEIYWAHSPEMKRCRDALASAGIEGWQP